MKDLREVVVVVPTIRESCIRAFLSAWSTGLRGARIVVVEDNPERTFDLGGHDGVEHYAWSDIDAELGEWAWIVPRRTDCVRSFGFYVAWRQRPQMIVTLDDDCLPEGDGSDFLQRHWQRLEDGGREPAWQPTVGGSATRGVPYRGRERRRRCVINHGLWSGVPDLDAVTQLAQLRAPQRIEVVQQTIPAGRYFSMCGMNLAFRPEMVPALYFLLMGQGRTYDRFGDIWAGVLAKRICDHLGLAINSGSPLVHHQRASNVWVNLRKEAAGLELNESFWQRVDDIPLHEATVAGCYRELADGLACWSADADYFSSLAAAMRLWAELFEPVLVPAVRASWHDAPSGIVTG